MRFNRSVLIALSAGLAAGLLIGGTLGYLSGRLTRRPPPGSIANQAIQVFRSGPSGEAGDAAQNAMANLLDSFIASQFEDSPIANIPLEGREDDKAVYIDILAADIQKDDLKVSVAEGTVTITGKIDRGGFSSRFERSFPVPEGADASRVNIRSEGDRVVIEFPK